MPASTTTNLILVYWTVTHTNTGRLDRQSGTPSNANGDCLACAISISVSDIPVLVPVPASRGRNAWRRQRALRAFILDRAIHIYFSTPAVVVVTRLRCHRDRCVAPQVSHKSYTTVHDFARTKFDRVLNCDSPYMPHIPLLALRPGRLTTIPAYAPRCPVTLLAMAGAWGIEHTQTRSLRPWSQFSRKVHIRCWFCHFWCVKSIKIQRKKIKSNT